MGIDGEAVVRATVTQAFSSLPEMEAAGYAGWPAVEVSIDEVLWQASPNQILPAPVLTPNEKVVMNASHPTPELAIGDEYLLYLSYIDIPVHWAVMFATDLKGNPVPGYDTPETRKSLQRLLLPGETSADLVDALVEFSKERNEALRSGSAHSATGPRTRHWLGEEAADPLEVFVSDWNATPPDHRYLPLDPSDLPAGAEEALGVLFVPYEIAVIDNDGTLADVDTLSIRFPDVGILGDFLVDHDTGITTIIGYGPQGLAGMLQAHPTAAPDTPAPNARTLGTIDPTRRRGPIDPNDEGVTAVVTITAGTATIQVVGRDEYDQAIMNLQHRIETAPTKP